MGAAVSSGMACNHAQHKLSHLASALKMLESEDICTKLTVGLHGQCAHIMAMAVQKLHPGTQVTIGPWIERGFYYDFDTKEPLSNKDLKAIKKEMQRLIKRKLPMSEEEVRHGQALVTFCMLQVSAMHLMSC